MSTKTNFKRVALVAVAALGLGVLTSVAPANATDNSAPNAAGPSAVAGVLNIGTATNTGAVVIATDTTASSVGLVATSDISGTRIAGTTQTAILLSSGTLAVYTLASATAGDTNAIVAFTVENGSVTGTLNGDAVNAGSTVAVGSVAGTFAASIKPNSGATTMTVRMYSAPSATYGSSSIDATSIGTATAAPSLGTLRGQITVTIASTSSAGVMAPAKSGVYYSSSNTDGANTSDATSGTWYTKSPASQFANIRVKDAYGTVIAATTGLLQASATNGAIVSLNDNTGASGTASTAFYTGASPDDVMLTVNAPKFMALSTVVTVTYNGVVVGTKSFTFTGPVTKVTLGAPLLIKKTNTSGSTSQGIGISFADSAGNTIYPASGDSYYPSSSFLTNSGSDRTAVMAQLPTSSQAGYLDWDCDVNASTDGLIVDFVNIDGTIATSNKATVGCAGDAYTYSASYDKASYSPGEVATLTLTFKDSKGNLANDITSWSSGTAPSIAVGGGSLAVATTTSDASSNGKKSYSVTTIVTEGTYQTVVKLTGAVTWSGDQTAQIAGFTLKSTSTAVSNADVLKAIVSLIASINKQIAALQKALLRR